MSGTLVRAMNQPLLIAMYLFHSRLGWLLYDGSIARKLVIKISEYPDPNVLYKGSPGETFAAHMPLRATAPAYTYTTDTKIKNLKQRNRAPSAEMI